MNLVLERWCYGFIAADGTRFPTLGRLSNMDCHLFTVEDPWNHNAPGNSCIPDGVYDLVPHSTADHPDTWAFVNPKLHVWHEPADIPAGESGRFACLLHAGNRDADVKGCVAPGLKACMTPWLGVRDSDKAMAKLRDLLGVGSTGHTVLIRQYRGAFL